MLALCVNDAAVMRSWQKDQQPEGSFLRFGADVRCEVAGALGCLLDPAAGLPDKFGTAPRCKRFSMLVEDNVVKAVNLCYSAADATGDDGPEESQVEKMLTILGPATPSEPPAPAAA